MPRDPRAEWQRTIGHVDALIDSDAPDCLKAHYVVRVLLPRLAVLCGLDAFTAEVSRMLADGLALHVGRCRDCRAADALRGTDACAGCLKRYEDFVAEIEREGA